MLSSLEIRSTYTGLVTTTLRTEPLSFWFVNELHAIEVEPLDRARVVVATNHLAVRHLLTQTVRRLVGVDVAPVERRSIAALVVRTAALLLTNLSLLLLLGRSLLFVFLNTNTSRIECDEHNTNHALNVTSSINLTNIECPLKLTSTPFFSSFTFSFGPR